MSALIGALRVSLSADTAKFEDGMARARATSSKTAGYLKSSLGGVGFSLKESLAGVVAGLSIGLFTSLIKKSLEYAGSLAEVAQQVGVTARDLQVLRFAAGQVGVSQEQLEVGLTKLTITMGKVAAGAQAPAKALAAIGLSADKLKGKDTGEAFRAIADGLQKVGDRSQRAAVEVALFGKSGASLDNLLSGGSGQINELADAAERLGIVLSNEQIRKADDAADKLEALKTVLSASIAGVVADNAGAILTLANALIVLVGSIGQALKGWVLMKEELKTGVSAIAHGDNPFANPGDTGRALAFRERLADSQASKELAKRLPKTGVDIGKFLAPKGGAPKHAKEDHSAEKALREAHQFDDDLRRAQQDVLRAQQDLATDYSERATLSIKMLNSEQEGFEADLTYKVQLNKLTKGQEGLTEAQAAQLRAQYGIKDSLERQKVLQDESEQRQKDVQDLTEHDFDRQKNILESRAALATTAGERRKLELDILEITYEQKKQALQNVIDTSKNEKDIEDARRDLENLKATHANERQGVINSTRGPLEEWAASVPRTAKEVNEAFQSIETGALDGLVEALSGVIDGTKSLKAAFGDLAKSVLADIVKMTIKMLILRAVSSIFSSAFGGGSAGGFNTASLAGIGSDLNFGAKFATGGSFKVLGNKGIDRNMLAINGMVVGQVSHGEIVNIKKDGANDSGGGIVVNQHFAPNFAGNAATREDLVRMAEITKASTIAALKDRQRRSA